MAECEIVADAACHLKAIESGLVLGLPIPLGTTHREIAYVLGMLATLPLTTEGEPEVRFSARV